MIASECAYSERTGSDSIRILVARFVPKNIVESLKGSWDAFIPDVAPSPQTLKLYRDKEIKFPEFTGIYLQELIDSMDAAIAIKTLASLATIGPISLLCYENVDTFCHRRFVKEIVERYQTKCQYDIEAIWRGNPSEIVEVMKADYSRHIRTEAEKTESASSGDSNEESGK